MSFREEAARQKTDKNPSMYKGLQQAELGGLSVENKKIRKPTRPGVEGTSEYLRIFFPYKQPLNVTGREVS